MRKEKIDYLNATKESEEEWYRKVTELSEKTLFPIADSWYMGKYGRPHTKIHPLMIFALRCQHPRKEA